MQILYAEEYAEPLNTLSYFLFQFYSENKNLFKNLNRLNLC